MSRDKPWVLDLLPGIPAHSSRGVAEIVEHVPGIQAAVVAVRENQAQRMGADRFDTFDLDITLAGLQVS